MGIVALSFIAAFGLFGSIGLLLFYREAMMQRLSDVMDPGGKKKDLVNSLQLTGSSLGDLVGRLNKVVPRSEKQSSDVRQSLARAGFRGEGAATVFYGVRAVAPLLLLFLSVVTGLANFSLICAVCMSIGFGIVIPKFSLRYMVAARQKKIRLGLPDALDFMVICIEAGLGLDMAVARTAAELRLAHPAITDELDVIVLEHRAGRPRSESWRNFADRTDVDAVRMLATVLVQSEQLGTSITKTLRIHSDTLRTKRRQEIEERAAKTSVKLVFPLVLCIFPSLFVVVVGPEAIIMSEAFNTYFTN